MRKRFGKRIREKISGRFGIDEIRFGKELFILIVGLF